MKVARLLVLLSPVGLSIVLLKVNRVLRDAPLSDRICMVPEYLQIFACLMGGLALNLLLCAVIAGTPEAFEQVLKFQVAALGIAPLVALYSRAVLGSDE